MSPRVKQTRFRLLVSALMFAALTGCSTTRYAPVHCVTQSQLDELRKAEPEKVGPKLTGRADEDVKVLGGSAVRLRAWGHGLLNVLGGCVSK